MSEDKGEYFIPDADIDSSAVDTGASGKQEKFFTPVDDEMPMLVPETIDSEMASELSDEYHFTPESEQKSISMKRLLVAGAGILLIALVWQTYNLMMNILNDSYILGAIFGVLLLVLIESLIREGYKFRQSQLHLSKVEKFQEQAEVFIKEQSHGCSERYVKDLCSLYKDKPQQKYLLKSLEQQADYLNDKEVIQHLSNDFFTQLDKEALRVTQRESIATAGMVAVSQVAVIDSLVVAWRTMKMVNQINSIYGLSLTRIGKWKFFVQVTKGVLLAASTQTGVSFAIDHVVNNTMKAGGVIVGSLLQGVGVGTYVAKIGIEAMKQNRAIAFDEKNMPKVNIIIDSIKAGLGMGKNDA